jgi:WD40 repeat protein
MHRHLTLITMVFLIIANVGSGHAQNGAEPPVITPENAQQLVLLDRLGDGHLGSDDGWPPIVGKKVAWSPDGAWLAVTGSPGVRLYRSDALDEPARLLDQDGWVSDVAFSPDSSIVATAAHSTTYLWDVQTGLRLGDDLDGTITAFSPNGKLLALGSSGGDMGWVWAEVHIIDVNTGNELAVMESGWMARIADLTFSPDGLLLAATWTNISFDGCYDDEEQGFQVWQVADVLAQGSVERGEELYSGQAAVLAFSPDGKWLASGGGGLVSRAALTGEVQATVVARGWIHDVAYSPDGNVLAAVVFVESETGYEYTLRVFDAATGAQRATLSTEPAYSLAFSPDGSALAVVGSDRVSIWHLEESTWTRTGEIAPFEKNELSPNATWLALYGETTLALQNIKTGARQELLRGEEAQIKDVRFSPDGSTLVAMNAEGVVQVWATQTGSLLSTLNQHFADADHTAFDVSPTGNLIASSVWSLQDDQTIIQVWDALTGQMETEFEALPGQGQVAFSPDGKWLAAILFSWEVGDQVHVWNVERGDKAGDSPLSFSSYPFSPDGTRLLYDTYLDSVIVRDISTQSDTPLLDLDVNTFLTSAVFSHQGTGLAIALEHWQGCGPGEANTLHVWDVSGSPNSYSEIASLGIPHINDLAFNPEATLLAAATNYGIAIVDARNAVKITNLGSSWIMVSEVVFAPDGRTLFSKGSDGVVRVWGVP